MDDDSQLNILLDSYVKILEYLSKNQADCDDILEDIRGLGESLKDVICEEKEKLKGKKISLGDMINLDSLPKDIAMVFYILIGKKNLIKDKDDDKKEKEDDDNIDEIDEDLMDKIEKILKKIKKD